VAADGGTQEVEEPKQYILAEDQVRLREQPGTDQPIGRNLGQGTRVTAVSTEQRSAGDYIWLEVRTDAGEVGWVARDFLRQASSGGSSPGGEFGLSAEADRQFTFDELWPCIQSAASEYGTDSEVLAGLLNQESSFKNHRVHADHTGHGLIGLDDNGMLPDFERWSGLQCGRGVTADPIPPEPQIEYCARILSEYGRKYGGSYAAARAWHRGERLRDDALGQNYERIIRSRVGELFGH